MLYAWIDRDGTLCTTYDINSIPEEYKGSYKTFEDLQIHDFDKLFVEEGEIKVKPYEKLLEEARERKLKEYKDFMWNRLSETDWIIIKANELGITLEEVDEELANKRKRIRQAGQKIKEAIMNASTLEEINSLDFNLYMENL